MRYRTAMATLVVAEMALIFDLARFDANADPQIIPGGGPKVTLVAQAPRVSKKAKEPTATSEWGTWLGPNGNGISRETGLVRSFPEEGPNVLWRARLGTGCSGIADAGGRAITLYGDGGREYAVCFDEAKGERLWRIDLDADFSEGRCPGPRAAPTIDGDRVYVLGASGQLRCLATTTGDAIWKLNVIEALGIRQHEEGSSPTPLIHGKQLIVAVGNSVFALDKMSGKSLWKALDEPMNC
jgi:outer membrane protein assembly factor BamB